MNERILKCLVLDDEPHALKILQAYIGKTPFLQLEKATTSVWEAMDLLKTQTIDLLFLDIQMDELTGLQLLDVTGNTCPVILTTAYSEYALKGYEYKVVDYLLKPFSFDRFLKAVSHVSDSNKISEPENTQEQVMSPQPDSIFVKGDAKNKYHQVRLSEIYFIEGLKNYVVFNCTKNKIITLQNLKKLCEELPANRFLRIHKSYIVNLDFVEQIDGHSILINNKRIPIGSSYRAAFYEVIKRKG